MLIQQARAAINSEVHQGALKVHVPTLRRAIAGSDIFLVWNLDGAENAGGGGVFLWAKRNTGAVACCYRARRYFEIAIAYVTKGTHFPPMFKTVSRWFRRPRDPSGHVYYARLKAPQGTFYKLGYTSKASLVNRMRFAQLGDEKLIERELLFTFRKDAWDVEQTLLDHFDKHRAFGKYSNDPQMPLAGRGQSELFIYDILGLDSDLYRLSDEEAESLKKEVAETGEGCLLTLLGLALVPFTLGLSLLFIAGGLSEVFRSGVKVQPRNKRPQHPPEIKALIDSLVQAPVADIGLAQPNPSLERTTSGSRSACSLEV